MNAKALRVIGPVILLVTAVLAALAFLVVGGGANVPFALDPGPVVRWGLPIAKLVVNLAAAAMLGALVLALFALRQGEREFDVALDVSSVGAAVLTLASGTVAFLTFLSAFVQAPSLGPEFGAQLGTFLVSQETGRAWTITTVAAIVVTVLTFTVRSWLAVLITTMIAAATLIPMATQGHSGDLAGHDAAVTSLALHIVAAAVWLGGLVLLVVLRPVIAAGRMVAVLTRYSSIALAAFVVVTISGFARSLVSISEFSQLATPYGTLLLVKIGALLAMGVLGAIYRRSLLQRAGASKSTFWTLIAVELGFMGIASGAAAALARSAPPLGQQSLAGGSPAELLTGRPLPPELTTELWLTATKPDLLWLMLAGFAIFFYVAGFIRLRRRGDHWPIHRLVLWIAGMLLLAWVTSGAIAAYGHFLFSVHMIGHMLVGMAVPLLLVGGAPVTLAMRAVARRTDGSRGAREWILWAVHSPLSRVLTHPIVAAALFIGSLWLFYFTDMFRWALYEHIGHIWMNAHFLITGYLFALSMIGIDPVPYRLPHAGRLVLLIITMAIHAFFGIAIMSQTGLMVAEWFGSTGRTWGATPLEDQYSGGGIAWSVGELPTLITAIVVAIQWRRNDLKEQRRLDRHADRTGDAELEAYNAQLEAITDRDRQRGL